MSCSRFLSAIREHALGAPLAPGAAAHLAVCSECQAQFAREERLMAVIGTALDEVTSIQPASDFLPRLRTHVETSAHRQPTSWLTLAGAVTVAVAVVLLNATMTPPLQHDAPA